jgi:hypothetical protein
MSNHGDSFGAPLRKPLAAAVQRGHALNARRRAAAAKFDDERTSWVTG